MKKHAYAAMILATAVVAGCKVGPDYHRPDVAVPERFDGDAANRPTTRPAEELGHWWKQFNDSTLDSLIERSLQSNLDLKIAVARVRQARAARGVVASGLYPTVNASGSATRSKGSANAFSGGQFGSVGSQEQPIFQYGVDAAWELDIFGGTRRAVESAEADIQAAQEGGRQVMVSLLSEVALNYIDLRGRQRQLAIARKNIKVQRETLDLTQTRFKAGLSGELDVARAKALVATSESTVPPIENAISRDIHRLSVLLGLGPAALKDELLPEVSIPTPPADVPPGIPSELLRRRPDIRQAERQLASATAQIGVATADLFPKFTLMGNMGMQSRDLKHIADLQSGYWSFGPGFSWPVFDAGRIRSQIAVQNAATDEALATYQKTVLLSLEEVENAMTAWARDQQQRQSLIQSVQANTRAVELSQELYTKGLSDFTTVLDAQKSLFLAEEGVATLDQQIAADVVRLYKALGGGWEAEQMLPAPTTQPAP